MMKTDASLSLVLVSVYVQLLIYLFLICFNLLFESLCTAINIHVFRFVIHVYIYNVESE